MSSYVRLLTRVTPHQRLARSYSASNLFTQYDIFREEKRKEHIHARRDKILQTTTVGLRFARFYSTNNHFTEEEKHKEVPQWYKILEIVGGLTVTKVLTKALMVTLKKSFTIVPEGSVFIVERMGMYARTLSPGFNFLIPFIDKVAHVHSLKVKVLKLSNFQVRTKDNESFMIEGGVMYLKIVDPLLASYEIDNPLDSGVQSAESIICNEVARITVQGILYERETFNRNTTNAINAVLRDWGLACIYFEIRDTSFLHTEATLLAKSKNVVTILQSEAEREIEITKSEAEKDLKILRAQGEAISILIKAQGIENELHTLARILRGGEESEQAVYLVIARKYLHVYGNILEKADVLPLPKLPEHEVKENQENPMPKHEVKENQEHPLPPKKEPEREEKEEKEN